MCFPKSLVERRTGTNMRNITFALRVKVSCNQTTCIKTLKFTKIPYCQMKSTIKLKLLLKLKIVGKENLKLGGNSMLLE